MTAIVGANTWTATCVGPDPGTATHTQINDLGLHLANRTQWLKGRIAGGYQVVDAGEAEAGSDTLTSLTDLAALTAWTDISGVTVATSEQVDEDDEVIVWCTLSAKHSEATEHMALRLRYSSGTPTPQTENHVALWLGGVAAGAVQPVTLHARQVVSAAGAGTVATWQLQGKVSGASDVALPYAPWRIHYVVLRPIPDPAP